MPPRTPDCQDCSVSNRCLPFQLGLTAVCAGQLPHEVVQRRAGELLLDRKQPGSVLVVRSGWVARYVLFPDGRRQITDILLPGDFVGCNEIATAGENLPTVALSDVEACAFNRDVLLANIAEYPERLLELMKVCAAQMTRLQNLLAAMGKQSGVSRVAAFLLGLHKRLKAIGSASSTQMPYNLRQQDLADVLGMTQVHVSRTMRSLQDGEVLRVQDKIAHILNSQELERLAKA